ncbi:MAG: DUF5004 domain-containing protein [Urechidicola sp.]|nr:DUF5004 domain-containing protein [Urechidicola sp.]
MVYKLGIILMIFSFISCSSSEDEIDTIYGTWELTSYTLENEYDFNNDGIASNNVLSEIDCFSDLTFTLNNDSTVFYPESNSTVTMSYLADGGIM